MFCYAAPTLIRVMADLPRTATAKVQKAELRGAGREGCLTRAQIEQTKIEQAQIEEKDR